jgi:hypothetical protein
MFIDLITRGLTTLENKTTQWIEPIGKYLDKHSGLYKICVVAIHIFRASAMFALMELSPLSLLATCSLMVGASILYRAAIERYCAWKFAIPSMIGAGAMWAAKLSLIGVIAGKAFDSLGSAISVVLGLLSLTCYLGWICYLSHQDIENHLKNNKNSSNTSCPGCP